MHHSRRGFDQRSQLVANLDDMLLQSFVALDTSDLIPGIYCEATDLLRVPSVSISEKVETNTLSLQELASKIEGVRVRVSQPSFYNSLPVCSIMTFRTYLKENRQEL